MLDSDLPNYDGRGENSLEFLSPRVQNHLQLLGILPDGEALVFQRTEPGQFSFDLNEFLFEVGPVLSDVVAKSLNQLSIEEGLLGGVIISDIGSGYKAKIEPENLTHPINRSLLRPILTQSVLEYFEPIIMLTVLDNPTSAVKLIIAPEDDPLAIGPRSVSQRGEALRNLLQELSLGSEDPEKLFITYCNWQQRCQQLQELLVFSPFVLQGLPNMSDVNEAGWMARLHNMETNRPKNEAQYKNRIKYAINFTKSFCNFLALDKAEEETSEDQAVRLTEFLSGNALDPMNWDIHTQEESDSAFNNWRDKVKLSKADGGRTWPILKNYPQLLVILGLKEYLNNCFPELSSPMIDYPDVDTPMPELFIIERLEVFLQSEIDYWSEFFTKHKKATAIDSMREMADLIIQTLE